MNFQEATTILNACTKKSGKLLKAPRMNIYKAELKIRLGRLGWIGENRLSILIFAIFNLTLTSIKERITLKYPLYNLGFLI